MDSEFCQMRGLYAYPDGRLCACHADEPQEPAAEGNGRDHNCQHVVPASGCSARLDDRGGFPKPLQPWSAVSGLSAGLRLHVCTFVSSVQNQTTEPHVALCHHGAGDCGDCHAGDQRRCPHLISGTDYRSSSDVHSFHGVLPDGSG